MWRRSHAARSAVACLLLLAATACGTRLTRQEILAENAAPGANATAAGSGTGMADGGGAIGAASSGDGVEASGGSTDAGGANTQGGGAARGKAVGARGAGADTGGAKAPIVIGYVGWFGGLAGATSVPSRDAWVAWQKTVNARGGVNGHRVDLLIGDTGGSDARGVSIARDFVENKGAIALSWFSGDATAIAKYAESRSIPVIGTSVSGVEWNKLPFLFPDAPSAGATEWGSARLAKNAGVTRVGTLFCVESSACQGGADLFQAEAQAQGLQVVHRGRMSIAQPDYTAECLQMRNAGAQLVRVFTEGASQVRLAQSCGRQQYRPIWVPATADDPMLKIPELEGALNPLPTFPWFLRSGAPGVSEYVDALQRYAPDLLTNGASSQTWGWMAAKTFEQAAEHLSSRPTSKEILDGLWAMNGETLSGLAPGGLSRTFTRDRPTPETYCVFEVRLGRNSWEAPHGMTPICR